MFYEPMRPRTFALVVLTALVLATRTAAAIDTFEIQVYDGTANSPGSLT